MSSPFDPGSPISGGVITDPGIGGPEEDAPAVAAEDAPGVNPQMVMRLSFDGGYNYGNERARSMGKIGKRRTKMVWNCCGTGPDPVVEVSGSDPVKVVLTGANMDVEELNS